MNSQTISHRQKLPDPPAVSDKPLVDTPKFTNNSAMKEPAIKEFISGTIYFSGAGFRHVIAVRANDSNAIKSVSARSFLDTKVTFENVVYRDVNGKIHGPVSTERVKFQPSTIVKDSSAANKKSPGKKI